MAPPFWSESATFCGAGKVGGKNYIEKKALIYTTYGNIYSTFGLGVRHTGHPGQPGTSAWQARLFGRRVETADDTLFATKILRTLAGHEVGDVAPVICSCISENIPPSSFIQQ